MFARHPYVLVATPLGNGSNHASLEIIRTFYWHLNAFSRHIHPLERWNEGLTGVNVWLCVHMGDSESESGLNYHVNRVWSRKL